MTGGMSVHFPQPVTNGEINLAAMLLHIAHTNPEVVTEKRIIRCGEIGFPGKIVATFADVPDTEEMMPVPNADFIRIVEKLMQGELVCEITFKNKKKCKMTAEFLPVDLIIDNNEPLVRFRKPPQCYFEEEMQDGKSVRQMKPTGEMKQFMLECLRQGD